MGIEKKKLPRKKKDRKMRMENKAQMEYHKKIDMKTGNNTDQRSSHAENKDRFQKINSISEKPRRILSDFSLPEPTLF